jgi:hypothetical protein
MRGTRTLGAVIALVVSLAPQLRAAGPKREPSLDALLVSLELEKRGRAQDVDDLDRLNARLVRAEGSSAAARSRLVQSLKEGETSADAIESAEDAISEAEARAASIQERRRMLVSRISERARRIASLAEEIARRRSGPRGIVDPVSGRWDVIVNPGGMRGAFRLALDGTLVSGTYTLDGGFRGSLRGTYIGDKLTLQRVDAERGIDATFYGRVTPAQRKVVGTWEATLIAPAIGPSAGTWGGSLAEDETEGETE